MSALQCTVYSTFSPPFWTDKIVVLADAEDLKDIFKGSSPYDCVPLVIKGSWAGEKLTWNVSLRATENLKALRVIVEVKIDGFGDMHCMAATEIVRGGKRKTGEQHVFGGVRNKKTMEDIFQRKDCCVNGDLGKGGLLRVTIDITVISLEGIQLNLEAASHFLENPLLLAEIMSGHGDCGAALYDSSLYSDVKIKCEERIFPAHKMILGLRSPVFAKMLETSMQEALSNEILIEDLKALTVERVLKHMYTGSVMSIFCTGEELTELLHCADKYDIQGLKVACIQMMKLLLSEDTAGEFNVAIQKCCPDESTKLHFKEYCQVRHFKLNQKESYKKLFLENVELFM